MAVATLANGAKHRNIENRKESIASRHIGSDGYACYHGTRNGLRRRMPPSFSAPVGRSESRITPSSALPRWCRPLVSAMMRVRLAPASGIIALCGRKPMSVSLAQRRSDGSSSVSFVLLCVRSYLLRYRGRKGDSYIFRHLLLVPHATQSRKTAQKAPAASFAANIARTKTKHHAHMLGRRSGNSCIMIRTST